MELNDRGIFGLQKTPEVRRVSTRPSNVFMKIGSYLGTKFLGSADLAVADLNPRMPEL